MADRYPIGVSSYHDGTRTTPRGRMQTVTDAYLAQQLKSAAVEFDRDVLHSNGEHLTPNEGVRELDRQQELYDLHQKDPAHWALAAVPGYSTHGPQIGTAVDFGITRKDGTNRALTGDEFQQLYVILGRRGVVHTGAYFRIPEAWHCNGIYAATRAPITNPPLMGETADNVPGVKPVPQEADMKVIQAGSYKVAIGARNTWKISDLTVAGQKFKGDRVAALLERVEASSPAAQLTVNDLEFEVIRVALKKIS